MSNFTFTQISNSGTAYTSVSAASINNAGTVSFEAFQRSPQGFPVPAAILSGNGGGQTTTVADTSSGYDILFSPTTNNAGTTVFGASRFAGQTGVLTSCDGCNINTVASSSTPFTSIGGFGYGEFVSAPGINNAGTVAYVTGYNGLTGIKTTTSSGVTTTIADSSGYISDFEVGLNVGRGSGPFSIYALPDINDRGTVAFTAGLDAGGSAIYKGSGKELTTIADTSGYISDFSSPSINNKGTVAFTANLDAGGSAIYSGSGEELTAIADTSGLFNSFTSDVALNQLGMTAFRAELDNGSIGIFTGSDPLTDKVIAVGDSLLDSTVVDLSIARNGLNDAGQLAFRANLANGSAFIVRAEPVPEPGEGIVSVLALGIFFMLGLSWRRRKQSFKHAGH